MRIRQAALLAGAGATGFLLATGASMALQDGDGREPDPADVPVPATPAEDGAEVLLAWTPDGLAPGLAHVSAPPPGIDAVTVVRGQEIALRATADADGRVVDRFEPGWEVALDAIAVDVATAAPFLPPADRTALTALAEGRAVLGATAAALRRLGPGSRLEVGSDVTLVVDRVVADTVIGGAELAVDRRTGSALGLTTPRYVLALHSGDRATAEVALRSLVPPDVPIRFRSAAETPYLRAADAVLPPVLVKARFGEFAHRPLDGAAIVQDPAWEAANIMTAEVPVLGRVRCHRALFVALRGAMTELEDRDLAWLLPEGAYAGCWNPRRIGPGLALSRHAWGAAIDLNAPSNPTGLASVQDPRLVEVMQHWGFTWGGTWVDPDPAHFEYLTDPTL